MSGQARARSPWPCKEPPTGPRHGPIDAVPERSGDDFHDARDESPGTAEPVQGVQYGVAPGPEPARLVENRHGPGGKRPVAASHEPDRGRWASEGREDEKAPVPVAPGQECHASVAEAASTVVEDEVRHEASVLPIGPGIAPDP